MTHLHAPYLDRLPTIAAVLALAATPALTACAGDAAGGWTVERDTTAAGVPVVVNIPPEEGAGPGYVIEEALRIGTVDAGGPAQFGQIRGLEVLSDGRVAVLDALAKEVRIFGPDGGHVATFGGEGEGPGELRAPWGLMRDDQDRLWVPDHRNDRMTVFHPDSGYAASYPMPVLRYGFIWAGAMLDDGRIVKPSITLQPERREILRIYGPEMALVDSILLPPRQRVANPDDNPAFFAWQAPGGMPRGTIGVPFYPHPRQHISPAGNVWTSAAGEPVYRLTRATLDGDTTLIVETRRDPVPLADSARDAAIDRAREYLEGRGAEMDQDWSKVPTIKPFVEQLFTADDGRLWVQTASPDAGARFDVYDPDGTLVRSVATDIPALPYLDPVVRGDRFWCIVQDELEVQYVVWGSIREMRAGEG